MNPNTLAQNMLVARLTFLLALCIVRKVYFIVEQPASSVMFQHLGAFSLECQKEIHLYGNAPWLSSMARRMTPVEKAAMTRIPKYNSYCVAVRFTWPAPIKPSENLRLPVMPLNAHR